MCHRNNTAQIEKYSRLQNIFSRTNSSDKKSPALADNVTNIVRQRTGWNFHDEFYRVIVGLLIRSKPYVDK